MKNILVMVSLLFITSLAQADNSSLKRQALQEQAEIEKLEAQQATIMSRQIMLVRSLQKAWDALSANIVEVGQAAGSGSQDQLLEATKNMQETQMSFNLQYLQLQTQMQHENRSYTAVSNIMKTKHDTVKNSIGNIR